MVTHIFLNQGQVSGIEENKVDGNFMHNTVSYYPRNLLKVILQLRNEGNPIYSCYLIKLLQGSNKLMEMKEFWKG